MPERIKLTKSVVDKLPFAVKGKQVDYYDTELPAFGVRVSATSKVYFVRKRINGKMTRVSLGRHGVITADTARNNAKDAFTDLRKGVDLNREKAKSMERGITLQQVYDDYLLHRPSLKPRTISVDQSLLNCNLSDWLNKPIRDITEDMIRRRHLKIAKNSGENNANNVIRLFRRLYRFGWRSLKETLNHDLVKDAMEGQWFKVGRRQTVLQPHELPTWFAAVQKINNPIIRDYLLLLLFTGLRENEGMTLRWEDVCMQAETFSIRREVSKNLELHVLPMSNVLKELFQRRLDQRENLYVFPGKGKTGHLVEVQRQIDFVENETKRILNNVQSDDELKQLAEKITADRIKPGIKFCLHDLRRTFASIAEGEVSYAMLKRLINHKDKDVTKGYVIINIEKTRQPMQRVTDVIMSLLTKSQVS